MAEQTSITREHGTALRENAISTRHLVFFVVGAAAPLTVMAGVAPLAIGIGGLGAPLAYLLSGVVLILFAAGFTAMSTHIRNAGAFYAYIARGLGKATGVGAALLAVVSYNLIEIGLMAAFGVFAQETLAAVAGVTVSWAVLTAAGLVAVGVLGYLRVTLSARVLGVALALEVLILLVFEVAVLGSPDAPLTAAPLDPSHLFASGAGGMFVLSFGAFIGFESTAIYAEEARDPRRSVPRATYIAVAFLTLFYAFTVWMIVNAFGARRVLEVATGEDAVNMVFLATRTYAGAWAEDTMHVLIATSAFAATLAWHNVSVRYFYALGREGLLPRALGRIRERTGSPYVAVVVQSLLAVVVITVGVALGADPYDVILLWTNGPGILGVMLLQALTAVAVIAFFRRDRRGFSGVRTLAAPALGAAGLAVACALVVTNFELLTGATAGINALLLLPLPVVFAIGVGLALRIRRQDPERYANLTTTDVERG